MPNWLAREHQEATMDHAEVTVGAEDDGGRLAMGGGSGSTDVRKVEREARRSWWCK